MTRNTAQRNLIALVTLIILFSSASAFGFRCGRKLVMEDMHEIEVLKACGAPTTSRHLGYAIRHVYLPVRRHISPGISVEQYPGYGQYAEEVILTEYVYNLGPRKLMRRLIFEGGTLVKIETLGYGYRETKAK